MIKVDPDYVPPRNREAGQGNGYDGQFSYYMALDFTNARYYMDFPAYRYSRVLYPASSRGRSALGDRDLVPATMIAINWLAHRRSHAGNRRLAPPASVLTVARAPGRAVYPGCCSACSAT